MIGSGGGGREVSFEDGFEATFVPEQDGRSDSSVPAVIELLVEDADPLPIDEGGLVICGRGGEAIIVLEDAMVSRHHCVFTRHGASLELRDLGSGNGTYLNGKKVSQAEVYDGDRVKVGPFEIEVVIAVEGQERRYLSYDSEEIEELPSFSEILLGEDSEWELETELGAKPRNNTKSRPRGRHKRGFPTPPPSPSKGKPPRTISPQRVGPSKSRKGGLPGPMQSGLRRGPRSVRPASKGRPGTDLKRGGRPTPSEAKKGPSRPSPRSGVKPPEGKGSVRRPVSRGSSKRHATERYSSASLGLTKSESSGVLKKLAPRPKKSNEKPLRISCPKSTSGTVTPDKSLMIGRLKSCGVRFDKEDKVVSRRHARVDWTDDRGPVIRDLGSRNGISVNGEKVSQSELRHGDIIKIGPHVLSVAEFDPSGQDTADITDQLTDSDEDLEASSES